MSLKNKLRIAGAVGLVSLVGAMPLMARESPQVKLPVYTFYANSRLNSQTQVEYLGNNKRLIVSEDLKEKWNLDIQNVGPDEIKDTDLARNTREVAEIIETEGDYKTNQGPLCHIKKIELTKGDKKYVFELYNFNEEFVGLFEIPAVQLYLNKHPYDVLDIKVYGSNGSEIMQDIFLDGKINGYEIFDEKGQKIHVPLDGKARELMQKEFEKGLEILLEKKGDNLNKLRSILN